jgi:hypothetical protein
MKALDIFAGPAALAHIRAHGLLPSHVRAVPAAAGGPKGLVLGRLDRFLFGQWLTQSSQPVDLVGASIGAWRMATACLQEPVGVFAQLERDYIHQDYPLEPGKRFPTPDRISADFGANLRAFYAGRVPELLAHPRFRLHVITSRGRHVLARETPLRAGLGYAGAYLSNLVSRRALGAWLDRVVFSSHAGAGLPFADDGFPTHAVALTEANFADALQASCSIPFVLRAVSGIAGAPAGAHWDGGITDYHLHMDWRGRQFATESVAKNPATPADFATFDPKNTPQAASLVLYPHFQRAVVPGWLDKALKWRHPATAFLDHMVLLAPKAEWIAGLPRAKLPDRTDFAHFGTNLSARVQSWQAAAGASQALADEFAQWLERPDPSVVQPL